MGLFSGQLANVVEWEEFRDKFRRKLEDNFITVGKKNRAGPL